MDTQSQSQLKKCASCRRKLPLRCFGVLRTTKDGWNYTCKGCRNYRRRSAYWDAPDVGSDIIFPLRENNEAALNAQKPKMGGVNLKTGASIQFSIYKDEKYGTVYQIEEDGRTVLLFASNSEADINRTSFLNILTKHEIRLQLFQHPSNIF